MKTTLMSHMDKDFPYNRLRYKWVYAFTENEENIMSLLKKYFTSTKNIRCTNSIARNNISQY